MANSSNSMLMCLDLGRALSRASRRSPNVGSNHSQPLQWSTVAGIVGEKMKDAPAVLTATCLYKRGTKTAPGAFLRRSPQAKPQMQKGNSAKRGIEQRTQMFTVRWLGWNVVPTSNLAWFSLNYFSMWTKSETMAAAASEIDEVLWSPIQPNH